MKITSPVVGISLAGLVLAVGLALTAHGSDVRPLATFRTTDLQVDDTATVNGTIHLATGTGQSATFTTQRAASTEGNNICIGGGCQTVAYDGVNAQTGSHNASLGLLSLSSVTTGYQNIAIGESSLETNTTGHDNTAVGFRALMSNDVGFENVAVGQVALAACTGGSSNVAVGGTALQHSTSAGANTAVGATAMQNLITGDFNVAVGDQALSTSTNTMRNVAVGANSLLGLTSGWANVAVGWSAGQSLQGSIAETAVGYFSLQNDTGGSGNTAIGGTTGADLTIGTFNVFVGGITGGGLSTGSFNTIVGAQISSIPAAATSKIILSDGTGTQTDQLWISPTAPTSVNHGSIGTGSTNSWGNVASVGANTSVTLTFSTSGFPNLAWCQATTESGNQHINVTRSNTAPVFSCVDNTTGVAANCVDFTYWCTGQ